MWRWLHQYASARQFYSTSGRWLPWLGLLCLVLIGYGLIGGLYLAPPDFQQGQGYRIIYVHVPVAFLSLSIYVFMAVTALIGFIWKTKLAHMSVKVTAPIGAWFTFLALVTGSLWGKPMWGTYWVWDARLTSELILLFLYLGVIGLHQAIMDRKQADKAAGLLAIVGVINVPIIHYSVYWWNTLHQGDSINFFGKTTIATSMLHPLMAMIVGFSALFLILFIVNMRSEILLREAKTTWVKELISI
ncbi:MAG: heme ABC transporter permease [Pseudomonadota bacterium]